MPGKEKLILLAIITAMLLFMIVFTLIVTSSSEIEQDGEIGNLLWVDTMQEVIRKKYSCLSYLLDNAVKQIIKEYPEIHDYAFFSYNTFQGRMMIFIRNSAITAYNASIHYLKVIRHKSRGIRRSFIELAPYTKAELKQ